MRIVIFGAKGMLGQDLVEVFTDHEVIGVDRPQVDITDFEALQQFLNSEEPELIINAAAYNSVDEAESEDGQNIAMLVNGDGPGNIAEVASDLDVPFIHFSTDYVFDGQNKDGYTEDHEPCPVNFYGKSKLAGEENADDAGDKVYLIRTSRLFGTSGESELAKQSFVDLMTTLAETRDELDVVHEEVCSPTYSADLAYRVREIVDGEYPPDIYHVTNEGGCTWFEFAREIFKIVGKDVKLNKVGAEAFPRPAARPAHSVLINTKLPEMRPWQDALAEYLTK